MKQIRSLMILCMSAFPIAANAQSLEESYAKMCVDAAEKKGETCSALRRAIIEKLSKENSQEITQPISMPSSDVHSGNAVQSSRVLQRSAADSADPADPFGFLSRLVGTQWASEDLGDTIPGNRKRVYREFATFSVLDGGQTLEIEDGMDISSVDEPSRIITLRQRGEKGTFDGEIFQPHINMRWKTTFRISENDAIVSDWYKVAEPSGGMKQAFARIEYRLMPDGTLHKGGAFGWGKDRPALIEPSDPRVQRSRLRSYGSQEFTQLVAEQVASWPDLIESRLAVESEIAEFKERKRREAAERRASGGGFLRSLLGAAMGAYVGVGSGLSGNELVGAMMKGMSVVNPQSQIASTLGSMGDSLITGNGASVPSLISVPKAASYAAKPNLALSACPGFTESNYRSRALQGGGDSQLYTMCGQAFEYYSMYRRAIAQGYSESDANRTYSAHEDSARVAISYLKSHNAN